MTRRRCCRTANHMPRSLGMPGRLEAAHELMHAVEKRQEAALGSDHPDIELTRHNLSVSLRWAAVQGRQTTGRNLQNHGNPTKSRR